MTLEVVHSALVLAVTEVTGTSDVIDPRAIVRHWVSQLDDAALSNFLSIALSESWERHLSPIARAVLAGESSWSANPCTPGPGPNEARVTDTPFRDR